MPSRIERMEHLEWPEAVWKPFSEVLPTGIFRMTNNLSDGGKMFYYVACEEYDNSTGFFYMTEKGLYELMASGCSEGDVVKSRTNLLFEPRNSRSATIYLKPDVAENLACYRISHRQDLNLGPFEVRE